MARLWCGTWRPERLQFTLKEKRTTPNAAVSMAFFTADGKEMVTGGGFEEAALWNVASGSLVRTLNFDKHAIVPGDTVPVAVGRLGNRAVTFSSDGWGALWDLRRRGNLQVRTLKRAAAFATFRLRRMDGSSWLPAQAALRMSLTHSEAR